MVKKCSKCGESFIETASYCPHDGTSLNRQDGFIGKVLDSKYKIEHLIGEGGMGNVYQAKHLHIGFPIAVKILHPKLVEDATAVERFRREARSASAVNHPNAVQIMDFGITSDNIYYLVMELVNGVSLQKVLEKETILTPTRAVKIMKEVCLAVDVAHKKSIVHRDLKPDNILILHAGTASESVKVIDFSIAKIRQTNDDPNITSANIAVGTPQYLSPEQAQGLPTLDHRADIYSLGAILYQMLTGTVPFKGKTIAMTLMLHIQAKPKAPREINPTIPIALEEVILKALAKAPSQRQQSTTILAEELELSLTSPESFVTKLEIPIVSKDIIENKSPINEADIATKIALPVVTAAKKTPSNGIKMNPLKGGFQKSGQLLTNDKDNILPSLQTEPKKTLWQRLFSWFTLLFGH
jgi:eukaryotic-like serine/threonine-protein kinase